MDYSNYEKTKFKAELDKLHEIAWRGASGVEQTKPLPTIEREKVSFPNLVTSDLRKEPVLIEGLPSYDETSVLKKEIEKAKKLKEKENKTLVRKIFKEKTDATPNLTRLINQGNEILNGNNDLRATSTVLRLRNEQERVRKASRNRTIKTAVCSVMLAAALAGGTVYFDNQDAYYAETFGPAIVETFNGFCRPADAPYAVHDEYSAEQLADMEDAIIKSGHGADLARNKIAAENKRLSENENQGPIL